MSITTAELIAYGSTSRPINDTTTTGGAIDTKNQPVFTQLGSSSTLEVLSSSGSDTSQTVTVTGRDASGVYQTSTATLSGTSPQALSAGTTQTRYEKLFLANTDATLTLTSATVTLTADPVGGVFTAGVAASLNDSVTIANRTNAPAGIVFAAFNVSQSVPNSGNLTNGSAIGVWILQTLAASQAATKNTFTVTLQGNTT